MNKYQLHHRDGFVQLFKDIHQSNLDDIEEQKKIHLINFVYIYTGTVTGTFLSSIYR